MNCGGRKEEREEERGEEVEIKVEEEEAGLYGSLQLASDAFNRDTVQLTGDEQTVNIGW